MHISSPDLVDERAPLLPLPHSARAPDDHPHPRQSRRTRPRTRFPSETAPLSDDKSPWISAWTRAAEAYQTGHLPSSTELLALCDLVLASPFLEDAGQGTMWERPYGRGRLGTGRLTREGERVRLALRACLESTRNLIEQRNPTVEMQEGTLVGVIGEGEPGDGWQDFLRNCRRSQVKADLPSGNLPTPDPAAVQAASISLLTLAHTLLASPPFRALLSDLVLALRDTCKVVLDTARAKDQVEPGTADVLEQVVDAAAEGALGASAVAAPAENSEKGAKQNSEDGGERQSVGPGGRDGSDPGLATPGAAGGEAFSSAEQLQDGFFDRVKDIFVQLQRQPAYRQSVHTLLSVTHDYLRTAVSNATPDVHVEPVPSTLSAEAASSSKPAGPQLHTSEDYDEPTSFIIPLLEPFTGGPGSLSSLRRSTHDLLGHLDGSRSGTSAARLRALAGMLDSLVERALLEPGWMGTAASHRHLVALHHAFSTLADDCPAVAQDLQAVLDDVLQALQRVASDEFLLRSATAVQELGSALAGWAAEAVQTATRVASGEGVAAVWGDLIEWVVPRLLGILGELPLPRFEFASPAVSLAIDPPSLLSTSFVPSRVSIQQSTSLVYLPSTGTATVALPPSASHPPDPTLAHAPASARTTYRALTRLTVEGLQLELRDVGYWASYHTGIPCLGDITESGLLDLRFGQPGTDFEPGGGGVGFTLAASTPAPRGARTLFALHHGDSRVALREFSLRTHSSSHPWLWWVLRPLLRVTVRNAIEHQLRTALIEPAAEWVGKVGWQVEERAAELKSSAEEGPGVQDGEAETASVWRWLRALGDVLLRPRDAPEEGPEGGQGTGAAAADKPRAEGVLPAHLHINRHGVVVDLDSSEGTVGVGAEGVVLPAGTAPIPSS